MIYPQNFEQKIGFDQIRQLLKEKCLSTLGEERVTDMVFSDRFNEVEERLDQVTEFVRILQEEDNFPAQYFFDVRPSLKRIRVEGMYLDEQELFDLRRSLETIRDIVRFLQKSENEEEEETTSPYPCLKRLAGDITVFPQLIGKINGILSPYGKIKDNASAELARIRRELASTMGSISRSLNSILRNAQSEGVVDKDVTPTMRDGRLVIPVAPALKRKIKGIVHDESASGKTVFIEPAEVVEANNRIRELEGDERREIIRILMEFSNLLRPSIPDVLLSYEFLAEIDFIRAKALFSEQITGLKPAFENKQVIDWTMAVHPLLQLSLAKHGKKVIPLDIELNEKQRILIISGPNAGGKSVCLKTVGLLQYMLQCGLLIPMHERSHAGIFSNIFIDIGDEQSIEQSLSTFSGHMTTIVSIMHEVTPDDLVLFDELGAGTDPTEGAALAQAILQRLLNIRVRTLATTHYSELKAFALSTKGVENASVEFDVETLRPTYRLSIGVPGKSNAFEISRRLGLPENLIDDAKKLLSSDSVRFEDVIANAEYHRQVAEREREIARQASAETVKLRDEAEKLRKQMEDQRENTIKKAKADARRIMEQTRRESESIIADLKRMKKEQQNPDAQVNAIRRRIENNVDNLSEGLLQKVDTGLPPKEVRKGDTVEILTIGSQGTVLAPANAKGEVEVQAGILKLKVNISQLRLVKQPDKPKPQPTSVHLKTGAMERTVRMECDVRGMALDEAIMTVDQYLDQAILAGMGEVSIIHGKGTGVLRSGIQQHLKHHMHVASCRLGVYGEGESGVTIVTLK